jgi:hypothetical protein
MLRLAGDQVESLFDELLPVEVRKLPADLAALDRLLADPRLLTPIGQGWEQTRGLGKVPECRVHGLVMPRRTGPG